MYFKTICYLCFKFEHQKFGTPAFVYKLRQGLILISQTTIKYLCKFNLLHSQLRKDHNEVKSNNLKNIIKKLRPLVLSRAKLKVGEEETVQR